MTVTETVYRHQLRPVIEDAASAMDRIFLADDEARTTMTAAQRGC